MMDRELFRQALEALDTARPACFADNTLEAIDNATTALRERLAQPEQEPVAWVDPSWMNPETRTWESESFAPGPINGWSPLYTAPRQWQGLTDEDVDEVERWIEWKEIGSGRIPNQKLVRYIEAKLKAKNS